MNILILTGNFGFGHNSAAKAIKEKLLLENPDYNVEIIDFIEYLFPTLNKFIYGGFNFLVDKCQALYNFFNKISSKKTSAPLKKVIVKKIDNLLTINETDLIISVFPICSQYISAYKRMVNNKILLNTCVTDIDVHEEWISNETNLYFVASQKTKDNLIEKGVREEKIIVSGIPVRSSFNTVNKDMKSKNILIMGGGLGLIPNASELLDSLSKCSKIQVTVIVGNNEKLFNKLNKNYSNVKILSFTNDVAKYMNDADLIVTKAGGITMFEAINTETPMFIIKPFLTQEIGNAKYIEKNNIGKVEWSVNKKIAESIINLINNWNDLFMMRNNMHNLKKSFSTYSFATIYRDEEVKCGM